MLIRRAMNVLMRATLPLVLALAWTGWCPAASIGLQAQEAPTSESQELSFPESESADVFEGAVVAAVDVSGLSRGRLSPGLRRDLDVLVGEPLSLDAVRQLATRIEQEQPEFVTAIRTVEAEESQVRVIFLIARIGANRDLTSNINARYIVESVDLSGVSASEVSEGLNRDLQALVGERLDPDAADRLERRLNGELPDYTVRRRASRGSRQGRIRLTFDAERRESPWIPYPWLPSKFLYHSALGWSGVLDIPVTSSRQRFAVGLFMSNDDDEVSSESGVRLRYENRHVVSRRVGVSLEFSSLRQGWRDVTLRTLVASPDLGRAYGRRVAVDPAVTVALNPRLRVTGGVSVSELRPSTVSSETASEPANTLSALASQPQMANAWVASVAFASWWDTRSRDEADVAFGVPVTFVRPGWWAEAHHDVELTFGIRAARRGLGSDSEYTRVLGDGGYRFRRRGHELMARASGGRLTTGAPLFERFTLGDSSTLRGWSKFDVAPAGGDRMFHQSLEYRWRHVAVFYDLGSVWDGAAPRAERAAPREAERATERRVRASAGFGFHDDNGFFLLAFPLNADSVRATLLMGVRF